MTKPIVRIKYTRDEIQRCRYCGCEGWAEVSVPTVMSERAMAMADGQGAMPRSGGCEAFCACHELVSDPHSRRFIYSYSAARTRVLTASKVG